MLITCINCCETSNRIAYSTSLLFQVLEVHDSRLQPSLLHTSHAGLSSVPSQGPSSANSSLPGVGKNISARLSFAILLVIQCKTGIFVTINDTYRRFLFPSKTSQVMHWSVLNLLFALVGPPCTPCVLCGECSRSSIRY